MAYLPHVPGSKSPAATGKHELHEMGQTKSGKTVWSDPHHPKAVAAHKDFTAAEHHEAAKMHEARVVQLRDNPARYLGNPDNIRHHQAAAEHHRKESAIAGKKATEETKKSIDWS